MAIEYIDRPAEIRIDAAGVTVTYSSGGDVFVRRIALDHFRTTVDNATAKLLEYDAAQRARVVPFRKRKPREH